MKLTFKRTLRLKKTLASLTKRFETHLLNILEFYKLLFLGINTDFKIFGVLNLILQLNKQQISITFRFVSEQESKWKIRGFLRVILRDSRN